VWRRRRKRSRQTFAQYVLAYAYTDAYYRRVGLESVACWWMTQSYVTDIKSTGSFESTCLLEIHVRGLIYLTSESPTLCTTTAYHEMIRSIRRNQSSTRINDQDWTKILNYVDDKRFSTPHQHALQSPSFCFFFFSPPSFRKRREKKMINGVPVNFSLCLGIPTRAKILSDERSSAFNRSRITHGKAIAVHTNLCYW
jgi:hypothetical protein